MTQSNTPTKEPFLIQADIEKLMNGIPFIVLNKQLLFKDLESGKFLFTTISEENNYTVKDYLKLPENAPFQLINKKLIFMPSPFPIHQIVSTKLITAIQNHVSENELGTVLHAPADVHLDNESVVQPDLMFISIARSNIIQKWIMGAPDFIVEILSQGTEDVDRNKKMKIYGKYNVIEYWIIHPSDKFIEVYHNDSGTMKLTQKVQETGTIISKAIKGFVLDIGKVF